MIESIIVKYKGSKKEFVYDTWEGLARDLLEQIDAKVIHKIGGKIVKDD